MAREHKLTHAISIGAILGLFGFVSLLILGLAIVDTFDKAIQGDNEGVKQNLEKIANDSKDDLKTLPIQPLMPEIIGFAAILLTSICGLLGIPLVFKR